MLELEKWSAPNLKRIGGDLYIERMDVVTEVNLKSLVYVEGHLQIYKVPNLKSFRI